MHSMPHVVTPACLASNAHQQAVATHVADKRHLQQLLSSKSPEGETNPQVQGLRSVLDQADWHNRHTLMYAHTCHVKLGRRQPLTKQRAAMPRII